MHRWQQFLINNLNVYERELSWFPFIDLIWDKIVIVLKKGIGMIHKKIMAMMLCMVTVICNDVAATITITNETPYCAQIILNCTASRYGDADSKTNTRASTQEPATRSILVPALSTKAFDTLSDESNVSCVSAPIQNITLWQTCTSMNDDCQKDKALFTFPGGVWRCYIVFNDKNAPITRKNAPIYPYIASLSDNTEYVIKNPVVGWPGQPNGFPAYTLVRK